MIWTPSFHFSSPDLIDKAPYISNGEVIVIQSRVGNSEKKFGWDTSIVAIVIFIFFILIIAFIPFFIAFLTIVVLFLLFQEN
jgi:hypothetical protein